MKKISIFLFLLLCASPVFADGPYYVKNGGNNESDGLSDATAWEDGTNVTSLAAGSDVYFKCGDTWTEETISINWSGTGGDRVVIGAYYVSGSETIGVNGDGKPVLNGNESYPTSNTNGLINVTGNYVTVQDLNIINTDGFGVRFYGADYGKALRNVIYNTYRAAVLFDGADYGEAAYNDMSGGGRERIETGDGFWPCGGLLSRNGSTNGDYHHNKSYNHYGEGFVVNADGTSVYANIVYDTMSVGIYAAGSGSGLSIYNNIVFGTSSSTWENPTTPGWHGDGIRVAKEVYATTASISNVYVFNNIIFKRYAGLRVLSDHATYTLSNISFHGNHVLDCYMSFQSSNSTGNLSGLSTKNNIFYNPNGVYKAYASGTFTEAIADFDCNLWYPAKPANSVFNGPNDPTVTNPNLTRSDWTTVANINDFALTDFISTISEISEGATLGTPYYNKISIDGTTLFQTADPDPNTGTPITVNTVESDGVIGAVVVGASFSITATDASASEVGPDTGTWQVTCPLCSNGETVEVAFSGPATITTDYTTNYSPITWAGSPVTITLTPVTEDGECEDPEYARATLQNATGATIGTSYGDIAIADDTTDCAAAAVGGGPTMAYDANGPSMSYDSTAPSAIGVYQ